MIYGFLTNIYIKEIMEDDPHQKNICISLQLLIIVSGYNEGNGKGCSSYNYYKQSNGSKLK